MSGHSRAPHVPERGRIKPALAHLKVRDVTEEDAGAVVRAALQIDAAGRVIGGRAEAGNAYRLLHHLFRKALAWGCGQRKQATHWRT